MAIVQPHVGFVLERSLGHVTHAETLARLVPAEPSITADVRQIDFAVAGRSARVPVFNSNWTVRAGVRARRAIREMHRTRPLDALFVHTQVPAVLVPDWIAKIPSVVSLDATPMQYDELGSEYEHARGNERIERLKWRLNRASLQRARHVVTWSRWAKGGVVDGYGIEPDRVTVLPPGVDTGLWRRDGERDRDPDEVRILFVGGDLRRKGGDVLVGAVRALQLAGSMSGRRLRLDLVTRADVAAAPGVHVHHGMAPNSSELIALFHAADIFALPTRADCLGIAFLEAGAAGLPLVGTSIAGVPEIVRNGETGLVVPPADADALAGALHRLVDNGELRQRLGAGAAELVAERFDAARNTHQLVELITGILDGPAR